MAENRMCRLSSTRAIDLILPPFHKHTRNNSLQSYICDEWFIFKTIKRAIFDMMIISLCTEYPHLFSPPRQPKKQQQKKNTKRNVKIHYGAFPLSPPYSTTFRGHFFIR